MALWYVPTDDYGHSRGGPLERDFCGPSMWDAWANRWFTNDAGELIEDLGTMPALQVGPTPFYDLLAAEREAQTA